MGYLDPNSTECAEGCVTDYYTLQYAMPLKDDVQDIEKVAVTLSKSYLNHSVKIGVFTFGSAIFGGTFNNQTNIIYLTKLLDAWQ